MPPNPPSTAQWLRRTQDMSSTCVGRPLLVLQNFPFFSLLLSIMSDSGIMLDAVLYVFVGCFVVRGCAVLVLFR